MPEFKYQMHTHTVPCSNANMTPSELIDALYEGGYSGCVLTNHYYNGDTGLDRNLPFKDFIAKYEEDYNLCKELAAKKNLDVIFGIEEHLFDGLEILCYGITPRFLYENEFLIGNRSLEDWYNALHKYGALCIQAHPYRDRFYINNPRLLPVEFIDGFEVFNYGNHKNDNLRAEETASKYPDLILTSGGDVHSKDNACFGGIKTHVRITDEKTLVEVLKSKKYTHLVFK